MRPLRLALVEFGHICYSQEEGQETAFPERHEKVVAFLERVISLLQENERDAMVRATYTINALHGISFGTAITPIPMFPYP
jgi:hypothetical protein